MPVTPRLCLTAAVLVGLCAALSALLLLLPACSENAPRQAPAAATQPVVPYPLDICIVDDEKLGAEGPPHAFVFEGREIKTCCSGCERMFRKDAAKYLARIDQLATAAAATQPR